MRLVVFLIYWNRMPSAENALKHQSSVPSLLQVSRLAQEA